MDVYVKFKDGSEVIVQEADDYCVRNDGVFAEIIKGKRKAFVNFQEVLAIGESSFWGKEKSDG